MKVNDELYILELPMTFGGVTRIMNLSLIADGENGLTLVDTGLPGQADLIEEAIAKEGFTLADVKQIVLTHQDSDHVGSLHALKSRTGIPIIAFSVEIPYIDGTLPSPKMPSPERLAQMPEFAAMLKQLIRTPVDRSVKDGEIILEAAGAVVVATPGHTPGHMSLYLPSTKTLITGDALTSENGALNGPMEMATPNMPQALESVKKLAAYDVETIVCYHGGLVTENASAQLKRVAASS